MAVKGAELQTWKYDWAKVRTVDGDVVVREADSMLGFDDGEVEEILEIVTDRVHELTREIVGEINRRRARLAGTDDALILDGIASVLEGNILEA